MTTTTEPGTAREARLDAGASDADAEDSARAGVSRRVRYVSEYAELSRHIQSSGLLERRYVYYWIKIIGLVLSFVAIWVVFALLGNSWFQLVLAAVLAIVLVQFGFLGHDASHQQIFASHRWIAYAGLLMILYVAVEMIYRGFGEVRPMLNSI